MRSIHLLSGFSENPIWIFIRKPLKIQKAEFSFQLEPTNAQQKALDSFSGRNSGLDVTEIMTT